MMASRRSLAVLAAVLTGAGRLEAPLGREGADSPTELAATLAVARWAASTPIKFDCRLAESR